jgi:hypothetical protein
MTTEDTSVEQVSEETTSEAEQPQTEQTLTEERVQQMIAQATESAKKEAYEQGAREMQSKKDREVADANRRVRQLQAENSAFNSGFKNLDEETQTQLELERLKAKDQYYQTQEQEAQRVAQASEQAAKLKESLKDEAKALGIDPDDPRIDWADDAKDYFDGRSRFSQSLGKIIQDENKKVNTALEQKLADMEAKLRKDLGVEYTDTSGGAGINAGDDAFIDKMVSGELPPTKENMERFNKIRGNT